jgi:hypothetical protein
MLFYLMSFLAGALLGSTAMRLYIAFVGLREADDDW